MKKGTKFKRLSSMDRDLISWDFFSGHKCRDLAKEYGVDFTAVSKIGRKKGVIGKVSKYTLGLKKLKVYELDCIAWDYYCCRGDIEQIYKGYGIDRTRVWQIVKQKRVPVTRITCDDSVFDEINEESAYWIGFLTADGNVSDNDYIAICLQIQDIDHLKKFKKFLKTNAKITVNMNRKFPCCSISIHSKKIADRLSDFGIVPRKTHISYCPEELKNDRDYWRGLIDGDGCIHDGRYPSLHLYGTEDICQSFKEYCYWIVNTNALVHHRRNTTYYLKIEGNKFTPKLIADLYHNASVYLDRKQDKASFIMGDHYEKIWG